VAEALRLFENAGPIDSSPDNGTLDALKTSLQQVAAAAEAAARARARLAQAVAAARQASASWRHIGVAAGVPYQTLHRQFATRTGLRRPPSAAKLNR
jgi:hypothetical protein